MMDLLPDTIRIFVGDIHRARTFYSDKLGLPLASDSADNGYVVYAPGNIRLLVEYCDSEDEEGRALVGRFLGLSFRVSNVQTAYKELLIRGVEFSGAPEKQAWGGTLAHFVDPDRNVLTLVSD
jgi:catechol 2,3-dioxygenase-like lactoylglutathione lyase family enzyme